jgi:hypothetical protein
LRRSGEERRGIGAEGKGVGASGAEDEGENRRGKTTQRLPFPTTTATDTASLSLCLSLARSLARWAFLYEASNSDVQLQLRENRTEQNGKKKRLTLITFCPIYYCALIFYFMNY